MVFLAPVLPTSTHAFWMCDFVALLTKGDYPLILTNEMLVGMMHVEARKKHLHIYTLGFAPLPWHVKRRCQGLPHGGQETCDAQPSHSSCLRAILDWI